MVFCQLALNVPLCPSYGSQRHDRPGCLGWPGWPLFKTSQPEQSTYKAKLYRLVVPSKDDCSVSDGSYVVGSRYSVVAGNHCVDSVDRAALTNWSHWLDWATAVMADCQEQ